MKTNEAKAFQISAKTAFDRLKQTGNNTAFFADVSYLSVAFVAKELAAKDPRKFGHLPTAITGAQHLVKAAAEMVVEKLACPVANDHSHDDYAHHFLSHAKDYLDRDLQGVRDIANYLGVRGW